MQMVIDIIKKIFAAFTKKQPKGYNINNDAPYVYQKEDVKYGGKSACGVSTLAMITGEKPNNLDEKNP